jgi:hypothetical protein
MVVVDELKQDAMATGVEASVLQTRLFRMTLFLYGKGLDMTMLMSKRALRCSIDLISLTMMMMLLEGTNRWTTKNDHKLRCSN